MQLVIELTPDEAQHVREIRQLGFNVEGTVRAFLSALPSALSSKRDAATEDGERNFWSDIPDGKREAETVAIRVGLADVRAGRVVAASEAHSMLLANASARKVAASAHANGSEA